MIRMYSLAGISWLFFFLTSADGFQSNNHRNVSELLDNLLRGYDNSVRPDFGGPPTIVEIDIMVRSMGPISEVDMTYSMDCYFRQTWIDARLSYNLANKGTLALSISMLSRIWKPDTVFWNGKQSYLHTITTPNKFVRLYQDGRVLYSSSEGQLSDESREIPNGYSKMSFKTWKLQWKTTNTKIVNSTEVIAGTRCPYHHRPSVPESLEVIVGYTTRDVIYQWNSNRTVAIATDMKMSQFDLIDTPSNNSTDKMKSGEYSLLEVHFYLHRHMGNYLITVYGPCTLLVVLSWLSFWLNREATADRISLGVTTVLTICFLGLETRSDLPKVPYPTALDFFVFLSFVFIFATIIQFAVVHYFTKYGSGEKYFCEETTTDDDSDMEEGRGNFPHSSGGRRANQMSQMNQMNQMGPMGPMPPMSQMNQVNQMSIIEVPQPKLNNGGMGTSEDEILSTEAPFPPFQNRRPSNWSFCKRKKRTKSEFEIINSVSQIDRMSRVLFPLTFLTINVFYWYSYLYTPRI